MVEVLASPLFFWSITGIIGLWGAVLLVRGLWGDRSRGVPRCPRCWYDLSGAGRTPLPLKEGHGEGRVDERVDAPNVQQVEVNATLPELLPKREGSHTIALPVTCPECGKITHRQRRLHRTRRHWFTIMLGLLIVSLVVYSYEVRHRLVLGDEKLKNAIVPSTVYAVILPWCEKTTHEVMEARYYNRVLPNKGQPNGHGLWRWQEVIYQRSLSQIVETGGVNERSSAMHLLLSMGSQGDDAALDRFIGHMDHPDVAARKEAINWAQALGKRMLRGRDAVIARLEDEDDGVRQPAGWLLAALGPEQTQGMSDAEMCRVAGLLLKADNGYGEGTARDFYLSEMVRRGGTEIEKWLGERVATAPKMRHGDGPMNLEILMALRRVQGKPDPLTIELVKWATPEQVVATEFRAKAYMELPKLSVIIRNDDAEKIAVGFQRHGDNRGPRPERWRFEVRDKDGNLRDVKLETMNFGGISSYGELKHGEVFDITIPMDAFVAPLPAGEYRVILIYHNARQISTEKDMTDVMVTKSKEIRLIVEP